MDKSTRTMMSARIAVFFALLAFCFAASGQTNAAGLTANSSEFVFIARGGFTVAKNTNSPLRAVFMARSEHGGERPAFNQASVKQSTAAARLGPDPKRPYLAVRFAMPIPPSNATNNVAVLTGMDPLVFTHNHSPGFEILPNGDALAIYFSTPPGKAEADASTSFVQARLRYGSEEWDLPELFYKTENCNDQSGLLWNDHGKIWFFGGGRGVTDWLPFKIAVSTDNGATWTMSLPQLDKPAQRYTAQPITSAFRASDRAIYMAMDGDGAQSFLWRSTDDGVHWHDMGGRTSGRHSVIVPLDDKGHLLSIGGKNSSANGWSPMNTSSNWGETWSAAVPSPFPPLGTAQRPSLIRLASGNLFFVSDSYQHKADKPPPADWKYGNDCFVALSTNNGASWRIKELPVQLPGHQRVKYPTVGYVTARQAANGVIHILTTVTQPCLHYELNEAWVFSDAGDIAPETSGGRIQKFSEKYPNEKVRAEWSARICPGGRYLLDGTETTYYDNGRKEHEVIYTNGRKSGEETFWTPDGAKRWSWSHHPEKNTSTWTQYWNDGTKRLESTWNTRPKARDLDRNFFGYVAEGAANSFDRDGKRIATATFANGLLQSVMGK